MQLSKQERRAAPYLKGNIVNRNSTRTRVLVLAALGLLATVPVANPQETTSGEGGDSAGSIDGPGAQNTGPDSIDGTGMNSAVGTGPDSIDGTGLNSAVGTGPDSIDGTGLNSAVGTGPDSIDGTGLNSAVGTGPDSIDGTGLNSVQPALMQTSGSQYTVEPGDTLQSIALSHYGDENKYVVIYEANRATISNPDAIVAGQTLILPTLH